MIYNDIYIYFKDGIYLYDRAWKGRRQREKQTPRWAQSPMREPDPGTLTLGLQNNDWAEGSWTNWTTQAPSPLTIIFEIRVFNI